MGNGGLWSVHSSLSLLFVPSSSHFSCAPEWCAPWVAMWYLLPCGPSYAVVRPYCPSLTLVFTLILLRNFFFPLAVLPVWCCFLSFLKYVFPGVPTVWLMGSPISCGMVLELAVSGEVQILASPHKGHPWSPSAASSSTPTPCTCAQLVMQLN